MPGTWSFASNTATDPVTGARSLVPQPLNFNANFRIVEAKAGEVTLACINGLLARPEKLRIAFSRVNDVFKGTEISPDPENVTDKTGSSILIQLNTSTDDGGAGIIYPVSAHLVLKLPNGANPDSVRVEMILNRLLGALYETGQSTSTARVAALVRGAVTPIDL